MAASMVDKGSSRAPISAFGGDFGQLAAMMQLSWAANKEESLLYTEPFLRSAFDYPGSSFELAPSVYLGSDLAALWRGSGAMSGWVVAKSAFAEHVSDGVGRIEEVRLWPDGLGRTDETGSRRRLRRDHQFLC